MGEFTNPVLQGERSRRVGDMQWLLLGNNRHGFRTYFGKIDHDAGPKTMDAAVEMKEALGYPDAEQHRSFGQQAYSYLVPWASGAARTLPLAYRRRMHKPSPPVPKIVFSYPLPFRAPLIGFPFVGTHTRGNWQSDRGYDLACPVGTKVRAIRDGVIGPKWGDFGGSGVLQGKRIYVLAGNGQEFYYAHCRSLLKSPGQHVKAGDVIALSNYPGPSHLHITCRYGNPAHEILGGTVRLLSGLLAPPWSRHAHVYSAVPAVDVEEFDAL